MNLPSLVAPDLWPPMGISRQENAEVRGLNAAVIAMRYYVEKLAAALELYRFCRAKPANVKSGLAWDWQWIAIHDATMQIWFLRDAMDIMRRKSVPACSIVHALADYGVMERAIELFDTYFPEFKKMRDAIAHAPGLELAPTKKAPKDGLYAGPRLKDGDRYELVNNGIRYSMEMTTGTLDKLTEVLVAYWSAFRPVEKAFEERGRSE